MDSRSHLRPGRFLLIFGLSLLLGTSCTRETVNDEEVLSTLEEQMSSADTTTIIYLKETSCFNCDAYIYNVAERLRDRNVLFTTSRSTRHKVSIELIRDRFSPMDIEEDQILSSNDLPYLTSITHPKEFSRSNVLVYDAAGKLIYSHLDHLNQPKQINDLLQFYND